MTKEDILIKLENFYIYEKISIDIKNQALQLINILPLKYINLIDNDYCYISEHETIIIEWRINSFIVSIDIGKTYSTFYSILHGGKTILADNVTFNVVNESLLEALELLYLL